MTAGIVVRWEPGAELMQRATAHGLGIAAGYGWALPFTRTMFVECGQAIPWDLVDFGARLLRTWDVAAPLSPTLAADLGTEDERERTRAVMIDLRTPTYTPDLLLVRNSEGGRTFLETWQRECFGGTKALAFLRALHMVKPLFMALPALWLAPESERAQRDAVALTGVCDDVTPSAVPTRTVTREQIARERMLAQRRRMRRRAAA